VSVFISTIAVGILLQGAANGLFGGVERKAPPLAAGPAVPLGDIVVGRQTLAIILVAGLAIAALHLLLSHTQFGRRLRAAADDPAIARALGVRVTAMTAAAFALAAALAGVAGLLLANQYFVTPTVGLLFMLKAYIAVTIGGWGNLKGAAIGALAIGEFEIFAATFLSTTVAEVALYGVLILVLVVRPQGLFGEPAGRRA
jgi:branched-chain amino acid transport system permease protein